MERALIVQKFWLDKIFDEGKVWEMRTTRTNVRGTVGLIEGGSGLIVGSVDVMGSFLLKSPELFIPQHQVEDLSLLEKWPYAWVLSNAKRFDQPIPYKHHRGAVIWVKLDK